MDQVNTVRSHCNGCSGMRNHLVLHRYEETWEAEGSDDSPFPIGGEEIYELLKCAGCNKITFRHTGTCSEDTDSQGQLLPTVNYYPPAMFRREPDWLDFIDLDTDGEGIKLARPPDFVRRLLREIYVALHGNCLGLAAMGVRALLETVMIDRVADQGSFVKNLKDFEEQGYISQLQKEALVAVLEVGHASIHRSYDPSRSEIKHALDITENLIEGVYISHLKAAELKRRIPPRPRRL
jgi:Domain of unknown function (DUF4145)